MKTLFQHFKRERGVLQKEISFVVYNFPLILILINAGEVQYTA
jgi:hypothetical protein